MGELGVGVYGVGFGAVAVLVVEVRGEDTRMEERG